MYLYHAGLLATLCLHGPSYLEKYTKPTPEMRAAPLIIQDTLSCSRGCLNRAVPLLIAKYKESPHYEHPRGSLKYVNKRILFFYVFILALL